MGKRCEVCGRTIKSGYKYCYKHRNHTKPVARGSRAMRQEAKMVFFIGAFISLIGSYLLFDALPKLPEGYKLFPFILAIAGVSFFGVVLLESKKDGHSFIKSGLKPKTLLIIGLVVFGLSLILEIILLSKGINGFFPFLTLIIGALILFNRLPKLK